MNKNTTDNVDKTRQFFDDWNSYHETVKGIDTWKLYGEAISKHIKDGLVLDIGNGGIFNYDISKPKKIVALDLSPNLINNAAEAGNIEYRVGNILDLDLTEPVFDQAVMDMLIHHLADKKFSVTKQNVLKSFKNTYRVLKPGGEIIIMESCLPKFFETGERIFFPLFRAFTSVLKHPVVFQWNWNSLKAMMEEAGFKNIEMIEISLGRWIIHLGFKIPTAISPVKAYLIKGIK